MRNMHRHRRSKRGDAARLGLWPSGPLCRPVRAARLIQRGGQNILPPFEDEALCHAAPAGFDPSDDED